MEGRGPVVQGQPGEIRRALRQARKTPRRDGQKARLRGLYHARLLPHGPQLLYERRRGEVPRGGRQVSRPRGRQGVPRAGQAPGQAVSDELCRQRARIPFRQSPPRGHAGRHSRPGYEVLQRAFARDEGVLRNDAARRAARRALDRGQAGGRLLHEHHGLSGAVHLRQLQRHAARRRGRDARGRSRLRGLDEPQAHPHRLHLAEHGGLRGPLDVYGILRRAMGRRLFWLRREEVPLQPPLRRADVHPLRHDGRPLPAHRV